MNNVHIRKKSLGNGDLSSYISKNTNNMGRVPNKQNEFKRNFNKVKNNQNNLNKKLKSAQFENKQFFNTSNRLPKTIQEIENNENLAKLLLRNPNEMTPEEKIYISSFSNDEYNRFVKFLKIKNKEISWRGNDWGSGHYSDNYLSINRERSIRNDVRGGYTLKKFLKLNYDNFKFDEKHNDDINVPFNNHNIQSENIYEDEKIVKSEDSTLMNKEKISMKINSEEQNSKDKTYENTSKKIIKELELFQKIIFSSKNEIVIKKFEMQNDKLSRDIENNKLTLKNDLKNIKNKTNKTDLTDITIEKYRTKIKSKKNEDLSETTAIGKIQKYCQQMNLSSKELLSKLDTSYPMISTRAQTTVIGFKNLKKNLVKHKILDNNESENFCNTLIKYHGEEIKMETLIGILETYVTEEILSKVQDSFEDEMSSNDDYDYFNTTNIKYSKEYNLKQKNYLISKHLQKFDFLMKNKTVIVIQKMFRGYLKRKSFNIRRIYINILVKRIIQAMRKYKNKMIAIKNDCAHKITYMMRKNFILKNISKKISNTTEKWFNINSYGNKKVTEMPFSYKNKMKCASLIQRKWRAYKEGFMVFF